MKKTILILSLGILLNACATQTANPVRLECPPSLVLPKLTTEQDLALYNADPEAYAVIVKRDELQKARRQTLCKIIESTQGDD